MTYSTLVANSADAILLLEQAGRLLGGEIGVPGMERTMLVSAIRSRAPDELDECQLYELADFIPLAFANVVLTETGARFPEHFGRKDSHGTIRDFRRLDESPAFREALDLARQWWPTRPDDVRAVAGWSGLLKLVQTAVARGSNVADLELVPPLLDGPDESCPPLEQRPRFPDNPWWLKHWQPKPWWKFW